MVHTKQNLTAAPNMTRILGSFLEVMIHEILYSSSLYPSDAFSATRHYGVTCHACRHPEVVDYIFETLKVAIPGIIAGMVDEISVMLYDSKTEKLLEKYCFEFDIDETVKIVESDVSRTQSKTVSERKILDEVIQNLERSLRDMLLRISCLNGTDAGRRKGRKKFSSSSTFKICVRTKEQNDHAQVCNHGLVGKYPELQGAVNEGRWFRSDEASCSFQSKLDKNDIVVDSDLSQVSRQNNATQTCSVVRPLRSIDVPSCGMKMQLLMEFPDE